MCCTESLVSLHGKQTFKCRLVNEKFLQLQKIVKNVKTNHIAAPKIISNPNNQLKGIVLGIKSCLVDFLETSENSYAFKDFYVTLTYNFPQENDKVQCKNAEDNLILLVKDYFGKSIEL